MSDPAQPAVDAASDPVLVSATHYAELREAVLSLHAQLAAAQAERDQALALFRKHEDEPQPECTCEYGEGCPVYAWIDRVERRKNPAQEVANDGG